VFLSGNASVEPRYRSELAILQIFERVRLGFGADTQQVRHIMDAIPRSEFVRLARKENTVSSLGRTYLLGTTAGAGTVLETGNTIGVFIMEQAKEIADAVTTLIKLMVDHPEGVRVECVPISDGVSLRISVDHADIGKVIGKQGRTARSLRILVTAMGMASKQRINLDIQE